MTKIFAFLALGVALMLGGCATTAGGGGGACSQAPTSAYDVAKCAQQIALQMCSFQADIGPLIVAVTGGQGTSAVGIATAVCAAVTSLPPLTTRKGTLRKIQVQVNGATITGQFVRR